MHVGTKESQRRATDSMDLETEPSVILLSSVILLTDDGGQNAERTPSRVQHKGLFGCSTDYSSTKRPATTQIKNKGSLQLE